ncbi:Tectonic-1 [Kappamyces sp. JEL0829]|nr:Tectonic-1 [Kappamyces sp. JEL0829]
MTTRHLLLSLLLHWKPVAAIIPTTTVSYAWNTVETATPATNWNRGITSCCDANCCCDADCYTAGTTSETNVWFNYCKSQASAVFPYCSSYLSMVNWFGSINGSVTPAVGGGLCVAVTNSRTRCILTKGAIQGAFFSHPGLFTADSNFTTQIQNAAYVNSITTYNVANQPTYRYYAPGIMSNEESTCSRYIAAPATACAAGGMLDYNYYLASGAFTFVAEPYTNTTVGYSTRFFCADPTTGLYSSCTGGSASYLGTTCSNMVHKATFDFNYHTSNHLFITGVEATFYLATQTVSAGSYVSQSFRANFQLDSTSITYPKSGNPGYVLGMPVLAGTQTTSAAASSTATAVAYIPDPIYGLTLPTDVQSSTNGYSCPSTTNLQSRSPVTFGENSKGGCTLWLKYSDLSGAAACSTLRANIVALQTLSSQYINMIGMYGNSSVTNALSEWISVLDSRPSWLTASTSDPNGSCSGLLTDFDIQFLYTALGSSANPQYAIVGARYQYTSGTFQWRCKTNAACTNYNTATLPFPIRNSVSFVLVSTTGTNLYSPPAPQIWATLPDDVWYPFQVPSS